MACAIEIWRDGKYDTYDGLGCVDITAFSHYDMGDIVEDKLELSYTYDFYYMTDDSYILCVGNKKEFYGNIYFVSKGKKKMICQDLANEVKS